MMLTMYSLGTIFNYFSSNIFHNLADTKTYLHCDAVDVLWLLEFLYPMPQKKKIFQSSKIHGAYYTVLISIMNFHQV